MIVILWAGAVLFGACSILRRSERVSTTSDKIATLEARAGIRLDSSVTRMGRLVTIDRRWEAVFPHSESAYRYTESVRIAEEEQTVKGTTEQQAEVVHHREQTDAADYRQGESQVKGQRWWLAVVALGTVVVLWMVMRLLRFWPFNQSVMRRK